MTKPQSEKCNTCLVVNNYFRCLMCKYKTIEWINDYTKEHTGKMIVFGDNDCYMPKAESEDKG